MNKQSDVKTPFTPVFKMYTTYNVTMVGSTIFQFLDVTSTIPLNLPARASYDQGSLRTTHPSEIAHSEEILLDIACWG